VREILEVEAVDQAVGRISKQEIEILKELVTDKDSPDLPTLNLEFHVAIARASGNRILVEFIERLLLLMHGLLLLDPHLAAWEKEGGMEEEKAIIEFIEARDRVAAREAMRSHIRNTLNVILGRLETPRQRTP
jgi:DNA-binding GntR family transcriptional regulator